MIQSFRSKDTEALARNGDCRRFHAIARVALRLEPLHGDREGQWSIRINDQWRICFRWEADGAHDVEIVDYH